MKPIIIVPPKALSDEDIKLLRENDLCVVVAADPSKLKFLDPIPAISSRTAIENAAIKLSRKVLAGQFTNVHAVDAIGYRKAVAELYVEILVQGTSLDPNGSQEEQEQKHFDREKWDELSRLARVEAKAERDAEKKKRLAEQAAKEAASKEKKT